MSNYARPRAHRKPLFAAVALALVAAAPVASAYEFQFENSELTGSIDTTVSYGYSWRTDDADANLIGKSYFEPNLCWNNVPLGAIPVGFGRCAGTGGVPGSPYQQAALGRFSANRDDGNLNYEEGDPISSAVKLTTELSLNYRDSGFFGRATYFYDFENADRNDLSDTARERVGERLRLLDAFVFHNFDIGERTGTVRFGRQVISWGEGTFIQNGVNVINPVDLSSLRVAGAELKEAFLPVTSVWGSFQLAENLSLEGTYLFDFQAIEIDAAGTYFSANDFASPGARYVMLGFGTTPQPVYNPDFYAATCLSGPAGYANSDRLGDLLDYYSFLGAGATAAALGTIQIGCGNAVTRGQNREARDDGQWGLALRWYAESLNETEFGFYFLNYHSRLPLLSGTATSISAAQLAGGASPAAYANYFVEYPEDIQMFGLSWNTTLPGGVAWQGEFSYRPNMPLQFDDVELLFAALTPVNDILILNPLTPPALYFQSQLGDFNAGDYVRGWDRYEMSQLQMTFTKVFGQVLGADQIATVLELGATEVWDMPAQSEIRFEGEGTDTGGGCDVGDVLGAGFPGPGAFLYSCLRNPLTLTSGFPTAFSWGYRLALRADYNNAFGGPITLSPRLAFNHDVSGITPGPGGNFLEGRKSLTVGVEANYLNSWVFDLSYTRFSGSEDLNQIHDRDFASFSVKYSF
jgi:hypothetical protein